MIALLIGCEKHESDVPILPHPPIGVTSFSHTGCNDLSKANDEYIYEYIEYTAVDKEYLHVNHCNIIFGCCASEAPISVECTLKNDTIVIAEYQEISHCNCLCRYDLGYKIGPLQNRKYTVVVDYMKSFPYSEWYTSFKLSFDSQLNGVHFITNDK